MTKDNAHLYLPLVQALADKKTIQYFKAEWVDMPEIDFSGQASRYRIKPTPALIPLGPEDVPPGSVIQERNRADNPTLAPGYHSVVTVSQGRVVTINSDGMVIGMNFQRLMSGNGWCINSSIPLTGKWDPTAWQPCSKQAPEA